MSGKTIANEEFRVLVVEDDEDMNDLLNAVLTQAGYKTICAADGEEAIDIARREKPSLILLDIMLPKLDGVEVCRRLSSMEDTCAIPIIMLTIKRELSSKLACYIAGAKRYITKPFGIEEVLNEVRNTLLQPQMSKHIDPLISNYD